MPESSSSVAIDSSPVSPVSPISQSYNGTHFVFRLLRCSGWGPELMNLGYFPHRGWLGLPGNLLVSLAGRQQQLAMEAIKYLDVKAGDHVIDIACGHGGARIS